MPISRFHYFSGLHSYDLVATIRAFHTKFADGEISQECYDSTMENLDEMRYGTRINDYSYWIHPFQPGYHYDDDGQQVFDGTNHLILTPRWFSIWGIPSGIPDIDLNDFMMERFLRDQAQNEHGESLAMMRQAAISNSTATTVPMYEDEYDSDDSDQDFWDNILANIEEPEE